MADPDPSLKQVEGFETMPLRDDNPSSIDLLGFEGIVAAVESTVTRTDLDPITVGVNAPWGGGKTTVLQLLQAKLRRRTDVLVVYVSPWEYDRTTDPKAALIGAVLGRLEGEVKDRSNAAAEVRKALDHLRKRIDVAKAVKLAATSALTMTLPSIDGLISVFREGEESADPSLQGFRSQFA